ncbi:MAG TPA: DUF2764 domain-containing protein [Candidatus Rikenella faecigallinarum]|uniref:DUF2764 domain-containing protein n=1 Tax=Candidatus Rikenella faecigallinarum TaxID=2838745 RepID=A0A9D1TXP3_9BACT|nr:DUF2764 domain-containing protein [Candidatus Rikenella faecigallinarum]
MQYYYLIAGLPDYPFDIDGVVAGTLRIDVPLIKRQIMGELSPADQRAVRLLYTYYDIENIIGYIRGSKLPFNQLGNLTPKEVVLLVDRTVDETDGGGQLLPEELAERLDRLAVPSSVRLLVDRFRARTDEEQSVNPEEMAPLSLDDLERELFITFYNTCGAASGYATSAGRWSDLCPARSAVPAFLRQWADCDRTVRNMVAAYKGRQLGLDAETRAGMIVETNPELREAYLNSAAADFGMKDTFPYAEALVQVLETEDFVERERKLDQLRADIADTLAEQDYFGIGRVMDYLIRLNILHRWAVLDAECGRGTFRELVGGLTTADAINAAVGVPSFT